MLKFLKTWALAVAIVCGASAYWLYAACPFFDPVRPFVPGVVAVVQPSLIFLMLFLTFCKVDARSLRLRRWHGWLLLSQCGLFALLSALLIICPQLPGRLLVEAAMLCLVCPTATAAAVVTSRLGGDTTGVVTYTLLINFAVAVVVPLLVPLLHPDASLGFFLSFRLILLKVFPMLILPFVAAQLLRAFLPRVRRKLASYSNLVFYLWAVSLSLAIAVSVRSISHSTNAATDLAGIAAVSLLTCVLQFAGGRIIGRRYGCPVAACQSFGQKNTVFAIWMGYTFLNPLTAIAGGFYSIWHNVFNSWQLYKAKR